MVTGTEPDRLAPLAPPAPMGLRGDSVPEFPPPVADNEPDACKEASEAARQAGLIQ